MRCLNISASHQRACHRSLGQRTPKEVWHGIIFIKVNSSLVLSDDSLDTDLFIRRGGQIYVSSNTGKKSKCWRALSYLDPQSSDTKTCCLLPLCSLTLRYTKSEAAGCHWIFLADRGGVLLTWAVIQKPEAALQVLHSWQSVFSRKAPRPSGKCHLKPSETAAVSQEKTNVFFSRRNVTKYGWRDV